MNVHKQFQIFQERQFEQFIEFQKQQFQELLALYPTEQVNKPTMGKKIHIFKK